MARRSIKGITVEIGGDTTGLDRALKNVNGTIRNTQMQLKDVNRLLKLDPANTELLTQKQRLLKDAISNTKTKLDTLKTAQEQAKKQLENGTLGQDKYEALQREIADTEQALKRLEDEAGKAESKLDRLASVGDKMEKVGGKISGVGKNMSTYVTAPIAAGGAVAVKKYAEVDKTMALVNKTMDNSVDQAKAMDQTMKDAAANSVYSMSDAAGAYLNFARAGLTAEQAQYALAPAMNLAAGEGGNLDVVSQGLVGTINSFGDTFENAGDYADVFANACNNSALDIDGLSNSMGVAAPVFRTAGYSVKDAALFMGVMADNNIDASVSANSLKTGLARLVSPAKQGAEWMEQLGIKVTNTDGSMKDCVTVQKELHDAFAGLSESEQMAAASAIFGKNQMAPWLALINTAPADVSELNTALGATGTTSEMSEAMMSGFGGSLEKLKSSIDVAATSFGEALAPTISKVAEKIQAAVDWFNSLSDSQKETVAKVALVVAAIGPFLVVLGGTIQKAGVALKVLPALAGKFGKVAKSVKAAGGLGAKLSGVFGKIGGVFGGISAPVLAVVAVIAVLVGAFVHLWKTNATFRKNIIGTWNRIKSAVSGFVGGIKDRLGELGISFKDITDAIKAIWDGFCSVLAPAFDGAFKMIATVLETVFGVITGWLDIFIGIFTGDWEQAWTGVKEVFGAIWDGIKGIFSAELETIKGVVDVFLGWFGTSWNGVWTGIKDFLTGIWTGITGFLSGAWSGITSAVSTAWETIKSVIQVGLMFIQELFNTWVDIITLPWRFLWENFGGVLTAAWEGIKSAVSTALSAVATAIQTAWNAIKSFLTPILTAIKSAVSTAWNGIKTAVSTALNAIKTAVTTVWNAIKAFLTPILNAIKTAVTTAWNAILSFLRPILNTIKTAVSTAWNGIKTAISTVLNTVKTSVSTAFNAVKSTATGIFDKLKSAVSTAWDGIKNAIMTPINAAKDAVRDAIDKIKSYFNFSWSLPSLKLPHFSISGWFSLDPQSVPHFSVDWYKQGGIMTRPTVFGMNGSSLMAGGEAGAEAILPLKGFYDKLSAMLDDRMGVLGDTTYAPVFNVYTQPGQNTREVAEMLQRQFVRWQRQKEAAKVH